MASQYRSFAAVYFAAGDTTGVQMENIIDLRITRSINQKSNTAEIYIDNYATNAVLDGEIIYKNDETIKIYASTDDVDITNSAHLIGVYTILNSSINVNENIIKIVCADKTYNLLSRLFIGNEESAINTLVATIVNRVFQDGTSSTPITTNIASTRSDSSAFPTKKFVSAYKTAYDCLMEISQPDYTGDNLPYLFYIDENNEFHWEYPSSSVQATILTYGSDPVIKMDLVKAEADSVAMIIYDTGLDKNGNTYLGFYVDENAGSIKNRMKFQPMTDISRDLDHTAFATNDLLIAEMERQAQARSRQIVQKVGTGLWQAKIMSEGSKYSIGALYTVNAYDRGFGSMNLRCERIVHKMNKNGWVTELELKEDVNTLENL